MSDPLSPVLEKMLARFEAAKPALIKRMGATALQFIGENFRKQGFQGEQFEPWAKRKDPKDQGRPILFGKGSGLLRRSPFVSYTDAEKVIITSSLPYSRIHNEGGDITHPERNTILNFDKTPEHGPWRFGKVRTIGQQQGIKAIRRATIGAHTTHMPTRRFMGPSPVLTARIKEMLDKELHIIFKS